MSKNGRITRISPAKPDASDPADAPVALASDANPSGFQEGEGAEDADAGLSRVLAELGADASESKVQIFRINRETRLGAFICSLLPSEFSLERIADDYGGGMFNIKVYVPARDETSGQRLGVRLVANKRIFIEGAPKEPKRPDLSPPVPVLTAPAAPSELALLANVMREGFEGMKLIVTQRQPDKSTLDVLREAAELRKILVGDAPQRERDPFDQFTKFVDVYEAMKTSVGGSGSAGEGMQLIGVAKQFISMMEKANTAPAGAVPALASPAPDPGAAPVEAAPDPAQIPLSLPEDDDPVELIYRGYVTLLVRNARANSDVNVWAQTIYDQAPEDFIEWLFKNDQWMEWLAKYNADVKLYPAWFTRLHERIKEIDNVAPPV